VKTILIYAIGALVGSSEEEEKAKGGGRERDVRPNRTGGGEMRVRSVPGTGGKADTSPK